MPFVERSRLVCADTLQPVPRTYHRTLASIYFPVASHQPTVVVDIERL